MKDYKKATANLPTSRSAVSKHTPASGSKNDIFNKAAQILENTPLSDQHVTKIIDSVSRIAEMRAQQSIDEAATTDKIRMIMVNFQNDSNRCEKAIEYLREFKNILNKRELGQLASTIIKVQLGRSPDKI
jgi:hypothetical protein